jgi:hypothetical protein
MAKQLPTPTIELVKDLGRQYDSNQLTDFALRRLFHLYPKNTEASQVLLKVAALNALYHTQILALETVALHIVSLDIDESLRIGDHGVVNRMAWVKIGRAGAEEVRCNYSFATKYCWWHNHSAFPIWDSRVDQAIWLYRKQYNFKNFQRRTLWD